jgi:hypothetical protein
MLLYDEKTKQVAWETDTDGASYGSYLRLVAQDDNNLVLYDLTERPLWATETVNQCSYLYFFRKSMFVSLFLS